MMAEHDFKNLPPDDTSLWGEILRLARPPEPRKRLRGKGLVWPEMPLLGPQVFPSFRADFDRIAKSIRLAMGLSGYFLVCVACFEAAVRSSNTCLPNRFSTYQPPNQSPSHPPRSLI